MSRRGSGIDAAHARVPKRVELEEGAVQCRAVSRPRDDRLHVAKRQQPPERDLGETATELGQSLSGYDGHRRADGRMGGWAVR